MLDVRLLIPAGMAGILVLNMASAIASGGGRELISREEASPYPVSPTTDHLGALVLAPLNIAWMIQAWLLLGTISYSFPSSRVVTGEIVAVVWLVFSTAAGQVVAWTMEAVRRGPHGIAITRGLLVCLALVAGGVQVSGHSGHVLDSIPTLRIVVPALDGWTTTYVLTVLGILVGDGGGDRPRRRTRRTSRRGGCPATRRGWRPTSTSPDGCRAP